MENTRHEFTGGKCAHCGCSLTAIQHFGWVYCPGYKHAWEARTGHIEELKAGFQTLEVARGNPNNMLIPHPEGFGFRGAEIDIGLEPAEGVRTFDTGATRDLADDKLDYEGFLSPRVLQRFAEYMHKHRFQKDGRVRDSDNWQKGMPFDAYMKSMFRHFMEAWALHRNVKVVRPEEDGGWEPDMEEALCGLLFNVQGFLHELLKED